MEKPAANIKLINGATMPALGLGTWKISDNQANVAILKAALDLGYRMIDTASVYGNEEAVGRAIHQSDIPRSEIFVITKLWTDDFGYASALQAYQSSLDRLGLDYADLYLLHHPVANSEDFIQSWRALERLYHDGLVSAVGVSNFHPQQLEILRQRDLITPMVNQVSLSPYMPQLKIREYCLRHSITIQSYSPLDQGSDLLSSKLVRKLAAKYGRTPAQIVLRWHIDSGLVPLPKSSNLERLAENLAAFDFKLSDSDLISLRSLSQSKP